MPATIEAVTPLSDEDVKKTEIYGILTQLASVKGITCSVGKMLWPQMVELPDIIYGVFNQWVHKEKMLLKVTWKEADDSEAHDTEDLHILLLPHCEFKLLKGSKGEALVLRGQARAEFEAHATKRTVTIDYILGVTTRQQVWTVEDDPEAIRIDARTEPRSKPTLARRVDDLTRRRSTAGTTRQSRMR